MKFFANKVTRKVHAPKKNDACRASEIKKSNRVSFKSVREAMAEGYTPCKICVGVVVPKYTHPETAMEFA